MGKFKFDSKDLLRELQEDMDEREKGKTSEVANFFCCIPDYRLIRDKDIKESLERFIETKIQLIKNEDSEQSAILKGMAFQKSCYDEIFGATAFVSFLGILDTQELTDFNEKITKAQSNIYK